jgi:5-oxoprolinase (ATP-hydrolysing) subunit B
VRTYGPEALLVEVSRGRAAQWSARIGERLGALAVELVPAATTVLVRLADRSELTAAAAVITGLELDEGPVDQGAAEVVIPVVYDGADLGPVAESVGLSVAEVVALHTEAVYTAEFLGFAPGFAYLVGLPEVLHLPRRATPRTRVPGGSVAIADRHTAVYPGASPGGWHLLGHTAASVWDPRRDPPALVGPGSRVRFESVPS